MAKNCNLKDDPSSTVASLRVEKADPILSGSIERVCQRAARPNAQSPILPKWTGVVVHFCKANRSLSTIDLGSVLGLNMCSDQQHRFVKKNDLKEALLSFHRHKQLCTSMLPSARTSSSSCPPFGFQFVLQRALASLKLRIVAKPCPTTNHFYLQPKTQLKASRRLRKRTSMTNNFVLC